MNPFYTRKGDDGYTGLLGAGRIQKDDPRIEAVGAVDEATAALGTARSVCLAVEIPPILKKVQQDLYGVMSEIASAPENAAQFRVIDAERVAWLEEQTRIIQSMTPVPKEFILPGDYMSSGLLDMARTIVRRAERRTAALFHLNQLENIQLLRYLNRLSSLVFVLELREIQAAGSSDPTLVK